MKRASVFGAVLAAFVASGCGSTGANAGNVVAPSSTSAPAATAAPAPAPVTLSSIAIQGVVPSIQASAAFTATARYSDGSTSDVTTAATWVSSNTAVASVSTTGVVTLDALGVCEVTATYNGVAGTFTIVAAS